jgi:hypothetical protein
MTQASTLIDNGFDIGNLDAINSVELFRVVVILDANGDDKSGFSIVGKNSAEYQAATHKIRVASLQRASRRKSSLDTTTEEGAAAMADAIDANELALAISVVRDWFGFASNGVTAPFDAQMTAKMLAKFPTWREKISAALEVDANFIKG